MAAVVSNLVARLFGLPKACWAPITKLVITQSSLGAARKVSWEGVVGMVLGGVLGAIAGSYVGSSVLVFGMGVFFLGLLSAQIGRIEVLIDSLLRSCR